MNISTDYNNLKYLVERIKKCNDRKAFEAFHKRFQPYLLKVIYYKKNEPFLVRYFASGLERKDLMQDIFISVIKLIKNFDISEKTEKEAEKILFKWLGRIANNVIRKSGQILKPDKTLVDYISPEEKERLLEELREKVFTSETPNYELENIERILKEEFTEEQREILYTYANENCLKNNKRLLPQKIDELALRQNTSKPNIKRKYHRAFNKLETLVKSG